MNVRITPRGAPQRTDLYSGIIPPLEVEAGYVILRERAFPVPYALTIPLKAIAEIALDEEPGDIF